MMAMSFSPQELKELAIEWALRKDPAFFTVYALPKTGLEDMCMLDTEKLDTNTVGSALIPSSDLTSFLEAAEQDDQRMEFLKSVLCAAGVDPEKKQKLTALLDEELKALGLLDSLPPDVGFSNKARAVAHSRVLAKHPDIENPGERPERKYDFEVLLNTLTGGHGGDQNAHYLYFDFKSSFWYFLETLQQATALSMIPPIDLMEQYTEEEEVDFSRSTSSQDSVPSSISSSSSLKSESTQVNDGVTGQAVQGSEAPGYSLEHGPWLYRIAKQQKSPTAKKSQWHKITGLSSYNRMVEEIKEEDKYGDKPVTVAMVHSSDKAAIDQWYRIKAEEARAERGYKELLKDAGYEDEDIGEPYMKWFARETKREMWEARREEKRQKLNNSQPQDGTRVGSL